MVKKKARKKHYILIKGRTHAALHAFGYGLGFLKKKKKN